MALPRGLLLPALTIGLRSLEYLHRRGFIVSSGYISRITRNEHRIQRDVETRSGQKIYDGALTGT